MGSIVSGLGGIALDASNFGNQTAANQQQYATTDALLAYKGQAAQQQGALQAARARMLGSQMVAAQRTAYANSGIDEKSGTAAAVQADSSAQAELDAQTIQNNAAREAWGFQLQRRQNWNNLVTQNANLANQSNGSFITGVGDVINGVAKVGG